MNFNVVFEGRDFSCISQPPLSLKVECMRWTAFGGAQQAQVRAYGSPASLEALADWLRCPVVIYNALDMPVWWGYLHGVSVFGEMGAVSTSLEGMANRVAVYHTCLAPLDQPAESNLTAWADDGTSQARYGVIEKVIRRAHIDDSYALQLRDLSLAQLKDPQVKLQLQAAGQPGQALLDCRGWMQTLAWKTWQTTAGMIANTVGQDGTQVLGSSSGYARLAQSIQNGTALNVNGVDVRVRRQGNPTDNLTLAVQADSGGQPSGSDLRSASVAGSSLENERYPWVRFSFAKPVSMAAGTPYWLVLTRSGSYSGSDYYMVGVDEKLSYPDGTFRIYNASISAWAPRTPTCDLIFRVLGVRETSLQLADINAAGSQFFGGLELRVNSGVSTPPYAVGMGSCLTEFERLLRLGTVNNRLMTARVTPERRLVVSEQPVQGARDHFVDAQGNYYDPYGNRMLPGVLPVREWVRVKGSRSPAAFMGEGEIEGT